jgi:HlyD family secretion protein
MLKVKKVLRIGGVLLAVLVLAGAGFMALRGSDGPATAEVAPATAIVTRGSIEEVVSATGNVAANRQVSLAFETSGPIAEVLVTEGQVIEAGQPLAHLDTKSLEWQISRSQASLKTSQARLEQAKKLASEEELASAQAALNSAISNLDKVKEGSSKEDLASAQAALDSAIANYDRTKAGPTRAELAAAQAQVDSARASLQQAQAAYDQIKDRPDAQMMQQSVNLQTATISLEQAQANYDAQADRPTQSELASAQAQVAQARAQLAQLQERPTASELAAAEAQVTQAEAQLAQLQERPNAADVAVFQAQVDEAVITLAQTQSQLEDTVITAPFAGTLLAVNVKEGEWASPGAPAMVLAVMQPLILDVNVDEVDVAQLAEGQVAYLTFDAIKNEEVAGTLTHISSTSTNVGGAVAYGIEISFDPGSLPVRLGMTADVEIVVDAAEDTLLVPNRAIEVDREADRYYVTRQKALGSVQRLEVRIGLRDESQTQILEGLEEGDKLMLPEVPGQGQDDEGFGPGGRMGFGGGSH